MLSVNVTSFINRIMFYSLVREIKSLEVELFKIIDCDVLMFRASSTTHLSCPLCNKWITAIYYRGKHSYVIIISSKPSSFYVLFLLYNRSFLSKDRKLHN